LARETSSRTGRVGHFPPIGKKTVGWICANVHKGKTPGFCSYPFKETTGPGGPEARKSGSHKVERRGEWGQVACTSKDLARKTPRNAGNAGTQELLLAKDQCWEEWGKTKTNSKKGEGDILKTGGTGFMGVRFGEKATFWFWLKLKKSAGMA